jgi:serine/threonine protein kinase
MATGLHELHSQRIAHQDLKPSNVLVFSQREAKNADLGRATLRGQVGPFDEFPVAGDLSYAPQNCCMVIFTLNGTSAAWAVTLTYLEAWSCSFMRK